MSPTQAETDFEDALIEAFNLDEMRRMLRRHLGIVLEREVDVHRGTKYIFADVVELAIKEGWRDDLVRGALIERAKNSLVRKAGMALGVSSVPVKATDPPTGSVKVTELDEPRLQKAARDRGVVINFAEYLSKLQALARRLCSIEVPTGNPFGTGWLVGPDRVLTNYHVVREVHEKGVAVADVTCRFDYFAAGADGVPCALDANWLEDHSLPALADERADAPDPTPDELDYALIRLARAVGTEQLGNGTRGWIAVPASPSVVIAEDIVMVPQFPDGRSLELAFGKALQFNDTGTRLRYDANTTGGASGSPAVTMALEPFGLHHAAGPARSQKYNQCVPLRLIIQRMTTRNVVPFWQN